MAQEQKQTAKSKQTEDETVEAKKLETRVDEAALEDVLDEIDSVLEENAQEFVDQYIQKGGQ